MAYLQDFNQQPTITKIAANTLLTIAQIENALVVADTSGGIVTATLPDMTGLTHLDGLMVIFKRIGVNNLVIAGNGLNIDSAANLTVGTTLHARKLVFCTTTRDAPEWRIVGIYP